LIACMLWLSWFAILAEIKGQVSCVDDRLHNLRIARRISHNQIDRTPQMSLEMKYGARHVKTKEIVIGYH
jgi:hypothetical protein